MQRNYTSINETAEKSFQHLKKAHEFSDDYNAPQSYSVNQRILTSGSNTTIAAEAHSTTPQPLASVPPPPPPPPPPTSSNTPQHPSSNINESRRMRYIYAYPEEIVTFLPENSTIRKKSTETDLRNERNRKVEDSSPTFFPRTIHNEVGQNSKNTVVSNSSTQQQSLLQSSTNEENFTDGTDKDKVKKYGINGTATSLEKEENLYRYASSSQMTEPSTTQIFKFDPNTSRNLSVSSLVSLFEKNLDVSNLEKISKVNF